ncbi:MAG: LapA family protein [Pleurocapsa sp.]
MFVIALRLATILAIAYLFGLFVSWLFWLFNSSDGGDDFRDGEPDTPKPPVPGNALKIEADKKRLVEVDESYYLAEFDLTKK